MTARLDLLKAEKELTRRNAELARRQELPWVPFDKTTGSTPIHPPQPVARPRSQGPQ
jgi:hypothetical protein